MGGRGRAKAAVHDKLQALKQLRARVEAQEKSVAFCKERAEELRGAFSSTGSVSLVVVGMMIRRFPPSLSLSLSLSPVITMFYTTLPPPPPDTAVQGSKATEAAAKARTALEALQAGMAKREAALGTVRALCVCVWVCQSGGTCVCVCVCEWVWVWVCG